MSLDDLHLDDFPDAEFFDAETVMSPTPKISSNVLSEDDLKLLKADIDDLDLDQLQNGRWSKYKKY
jgi:hypothetical protein